MSVVEEASRKLDIAQQQSAADGADGVQSPTPFHRQKSFNRWLVPVLAMAGVAALALVWFQLTDTLKHKTSIHSTEMPVPATISNSVASSAAPASSVAASPVPEPVAKAASDISEQDVRQAVDAWALAWSNRDVKGYLESYSEDFQVPDKLSLAQWKERLTARIGKPKFIKVTLRSIQVTVTQDTATVRLEQDFQSDNRKESGVKKELLLRKDKGRWLIYSEVTR
jgi:ketosteroid isomerase-like protein